MARIFAWCDAPTAPTGFGKSAQHVLHALHGAGHEIGQLAVNLDLASVDQIPWRVHAPTDRANDPYGVQDLQRVLGAELERGPIDVVWTTFDPEVPWKYPVPGAGRLDALGFLQQLRGQCPGVKFAGWFPVDGGPLSTYELGVLGLAPQFDLSATMASHVHDLIEWTMGLRGQPVKREEIERRLAVCPHGIDMSLYQVATPGEKAEAKRELGLRPEQRVVLQVERNQQRKQNYLALEVMEQLYRAHPDWRGETVLYQHMNPNEEDFGCRVGFNLPELAWRYGLRGGTDVIWPQGATSERNMVERVYAAADVFLSVSTGEGFQYPAWEALACGVPVVVPRDSARAAWFPSCPNAFLYKTAERRLVMRGGYHRRMGYPNIEMAARTVAKVLQRKGEFAPKPDAGRVWVGRQADLGKVRDWWVEKIDALSQQGWEERRAMKIAVPTPTPPDILVTTEHGLGIGDLVMAAPAIRALREKAGSVRLRVERPLLDLARILDCATDYEAQRTPGSNRIAKRIDLHELYWPQHRGTWGDVGVHRTDTIARRLEHEASLEEGALQPEQFTVTLPQAVQDQVRSRFLETFGVDATECVAVALESGSPHRALPQGYAQPLCAAIKAMGATPMLVGRQALGLRQLGTVDLTGQTDLIYLVGLLDAVGAVVTTDSAVMHLAAMQGTPTVCAFPTFRPEARIAYYGAPIEGVAPGVEEIGGERWPAGPRPKAAPGAWPAAVRVEDLLAALRQLTGLGDEGPRILRPGMTDVALSEATKA